MDVYREEYLSVKILNSGYLLVYNENRPPFNLPRLNASLTPETFI